MAYDNNKELEQDNKYTKLKKPVEPTGFSLNKGL